MIEIGPTLSALLLVVITGIFTLLTAIFVTNKQQQSSLKNIEVKVDGRLTETINKLDVATELISKLENATVAKDSVIAAQTDIIAKAMPKNGGQS